MELAGDENEIQRQIEQRINELPPDVQKSILSSEFGDKILAIGTAARLHLDQIQSLSDNTMFMMLGFTNEAEYQKEVQALTGSDAAATQKIITSVSQQILLPIRESMKGFSAGQGGDAAAPAPVLASTSTTSAPVRAPLSEVLPKKDVAMPATPVVPAPAAPASPIKPSPAASAATPSAPLPAIAADMHPADVMLTEKTVATPAAPAPAPVGSKPADTKATPPKPADYKADPYREPIN